MPNIALHVYPCFRRVRVSVSLVFMVTCALSRVMRVAMGPAVRRSASVPLPGHVTMRLASASTTVPLAGWEKYAAQVRSARLGEVSINKNQSL